MGTFLDMIENPHTKELESIGDAARRLLETLDARNRAAGRPIGPAQIQGGWGYPLRLSQVHLISRAPSRNQYGFDLDGVTTPTAPRTGETRMRQPQPHGEPEASCPAYPAPRPHRPALGIHANDNRAHHPTLTLTPAQLSRT